jgi:O-methyltransferase
MVADGDPRAPVWDMIAGPWRFAALRAFAGLRCADYLAAGPLTAGELAGRCGARPDALSRLLAWAASAGLAAQVEPGRYALTPVGHTLQADRAGSMLPAVMSTGDPAAWLAMTGLPGSVRTGQPAFEAENGGGFYAYLAAHPGAGRLFARFMASRSADLAAAVAALDLAGSRVVADIGGGLGTVLAEILLSWPRVRGILAEQPHALGLARGWLRSAGVLDRVDVVACDYLEPEQIPAADTYVLASILHNYDDRDVRAILGGLVAAAGAGAGPRVVVGEILLPGDPGPHIGYDLDMRMMALGAGRERTRAEYLRLLADAGLADTTVTTLPGAFSIIDARPTAGASPPCS